MNFLNFSLPLPVINVLVEVRNGPIERIETREKNGLMAYTEYHRLQLEEEVVSLERNRCLFIKGVCTDRNIYFPVRYTMKRNFGGQESTGRFLTVPDVPVCSSRHALITYALPGKQQGGKSNRE